VVGLPIIATEFDTDAYTESQRADDLENFYRVCFSHASVEGIIMWGFWEDSAWRWDGIVNSDWTLNAAGVRYEELMDEWTTEDSNFTDLSGNVSFRGFHGTYEITLSAPGKLAEVYVIELEPGETTAEFVLETNLESPEPDFTPPEPNPMTWASVPAAIGSSTITMTATTAIDEWPPVEYYFECITDSDANSSWQTDETYVAQGLNPSTTYTFRVKARDGSAARNETEWSEERYATTEPPGTEVEIIGSWVEGLTHTEEAGYNRALIFIAHWEDNVAPSLAVTYGGRTMNKVIDVTAGESSYRNYVAAFILDEPNITAANGDTFVPTWGDMPSSVSYASLFLQNVNQDTPIGDCNSNSSVSSTPNPIATDPLSTEEGDMVIIGAVCGNNGSYTLNNGFTEGTDQSIGSNGHTGVTGHKSATGVAETPSATFNNNVNRQAIIGFVVQPAIPVYQNCEEVQAAGFGLLPDLNGDCYVDFCDLERITYYWLNTDCDDLGNCKGADFVPRDGVVDFFDYSDFAKSWLQCNDPEDPKCTHNW
jgi:hypothetical protein